MSVVNEENIVFGTPCNHAANAVVFSCREKLTVCKTTMKVINIFTSEDMANMPCRSWINFHMDFIWTLVSM